MKLNLQRTFAFAIKYILKWISIVIPTAVCIGGSVALFLWLLNWAVQTRFNYPWLLYLLPFAGLLIHIIYQTAGKSSERGNNLIIDEIHEPGAGVPAKMAPVILITTIITHLFGGSAGREGTAVQIGGGIADQFSKLFKLGFQERTKLLIAGIAAGFGAVFGTPIAGSIFAIEVLTVGKLKHNALLPCFIAAFTGHATVSALGIKHTVYNIANTNQFFFPEFLLQEVLLIPKVIIAAALFGLASRFFLITVHGVKSLFTKVSPITWLIPFVGAMLLIFLTLSLGKPDYLSLGVEPEYPNAVTIQSAFYTGGADPLSWLWKTIYTALTLGTGFKGGEVTPLFYIGATLGNTAANLLNAPVSVFAALGFVGVFAGATKTPIACTTMAVEIFGPEHLLAFIITCFIAFYVSGKDGIYSAQRRKPKEVTA